MPVVKLVLVLVIVIVVIGVSLKVQTWARGRARHEAGATAAKARDLADRIGRQADTRSAGRAGAHLSMLGRTLVVDATLAAARDVLSAAIAEPDLFDPAAAAPGEGLSWVYSTMGTTRLVAVPDGDRTVLGVTSFDYAFGFPQGGPAVAQTMDRVTTALARHGIPFRETARAFVPGIDDTTDGPRHATPMAS